MTTDHRPLGAPIRFDLATPDVGTAAEFYTALLGWRFQPCGPDAGGRGLFTLDGRPAAAAGPLTGDGARASWTPSFHVSDADAAATAARHAGGTVHAGPADVADRGRAAALTDPADGRYGVWQPARDAGIRTAGEPGALCWTELYTTDADAALDHYRAVFGWRSRERTVGGHRYHVLAPAGGGAEPAEFGGLMQLPQENLSAGSGSEWHPYFRVTDCDAAATDAAARGATVLIPPTAYGDAGRLAMFLDPTGAAVGIAATR